jgi:hypothetical protein
MNAARPRSPAATWLLAVMAAGVLTGCAQPRVSSAPGRAISLPTGFPPTCAPGEIEVMLLGTYHFAGSTTDAVQQQAEDVLTPSRQAELEDLVGRLARWSPNQIAVEWPYDFVDSTIARYQRYVATGTTQSRNEVVQIGFRLAKRLGHPTVYPIDYRMPIGNDSIGALFARRPQFKQHMDSLQASMQAGADSSGVWRRGSTIIEHLRAGNTDAALHGGNSLAMFGSLLSAGEANNYGGPEILARWYERNIKMVHNLTRVLQPNTRRVLVLVGSGHVPPLRNLLDEAPQFCPVSPMPYLW